MPNHNDIVARTEEFVFELFKRKLPEYLVYHTYAHSEGVAKSAHKLALDTELGEEGVEVVTLAALLHDTGYTEIYKGHEEVSVRIAAEYLREKSYPEEKIEVILGCIRATRFPQAPKNILEEIVADADLSSLGKKSFFDQGELLRIEWERAQGRYYSDDEWLEQNIDLLSKHTFYTRAAQQRYAERQAENLRQLYKQKARMLPPPEAELASVAQPSPDPSNGSSAEEPDLGARIRRALYQNSLADQRSQFLFVASLVTTILLAIVPKPGFGVPWFGGLALLLASTISTARAFMLRLPLHAGPNLIENVVESKERINRLSLNLLLVSIVIVVVLIALYVY